jgi:CBS domain-containing protein
MKITARDIMSHPVVSIHEGSSVTQLLTLLHEKRFTGVPVVDDAGLLKGVIYNGLGIPDRGTRWICR